MKRILVTGANSYIGTSFACWVSQWPDRYAVDTLDVTDDAWRQASFAVYDAVFHVAGLAHATTDISMETLYFKVNRDLAVEVAEKARADGAGQFIFMSSLLVYGADEGSQNTAEITTATVPNPSDIYGRSKFEADHAIGLLASESFSTVIIRSPVVYGPGCKGNFPRLLRLARRAFLFPLIANARSMIFIDNLCEFVRLAVDGRWSGVFVPQNREFICVREVIATYRRLLGKKTFLLPVPKLMVNVLSHISAFRRIFGNKVYRQQDSQYGEYQVVGFQESIAKMAGGREARRHILVVTQYFHPEQFRINDICNEWIKRGHRVTVLTGIPNYPQGKFYKGYSFFKPSREQWNGVDIIRIPLLPRGNHTVSLLANYLSFVVSGFFWSRFTRLKADNIFIFEVSPMTQALPGVWFARRRRIPCHLYVTDLWPENVAIVGGVRSRLALSFIGRMVDGIYRRCDRIYTSSRSFIGAIEKRGMPREKLVFWPYYAEDFYVRKDRESVTVPEIPDDGRFNIIFAGNIGAAQGLDILPATAALLRESNVRFNIVGDGRVKARLIEMVREADVDDMFNFVDSQPATRIPDFMAVCDAALICLSGNELFAMTIPSKVQSCLACGIPLIVSGDGEVRRIVEESQAGVSAQSGDAAQLAQRINELISIPKEERKRLGDNALSYYSINFEKKRLMDNMEHEFTLTDALKWKDNVNK